MKGVIIEKGEKYFTYLKKIFFSINDIQRNFNWLITAHECYPQNTGISVIQSDIPDHKKFEEYKKSHYYDPHMFIVNVEKEHIIGETKVYENITINY